MNDAVMKYLENVSHDDLADIESIGKLAERLGLKLPTNLSLPQLQTFVFEETVEHLLIQPTFIIDYPAEVSPLARRNNDNPSVTDRFELFIAANALPNKYRPKPMGMTRLCSMTTIISGHWNTGCHQPLAKVSVSTVWSCCLPTPPQSVMFCCFRICDQKSFRIISRGDLAP